MTKSNRNVIIAVIVFSILVAVGLAAWVGKSAMDLAEARKEEQRVQAELLVERQQAEAERLNEIESTFNTLLVNVSQYAGVYKRNRKVMSESVQPINLSDPAYIQENLTALETLAPSMRSDMDKIMMSFAAADEEFKRIIAESDEQSRESMAQKWREMTHKHIEGYTVFFEFEDQLIDQHLALMRLYAENANAISYNAETEQLAFANEDLAASDSEIRAKIRDLYLQEAQALSTANPEQVEDSSAVEPIEGDMEQEPATSGDAVEEIPATEDSPLTE